jgi:hypothetical protein
MRILLIELAWEVKDGMFGLTRKRAQIKWLESNQAKRQPSNILTVNCCLAVEIGKRMTES